MPAVPPVTAAALFFIIAPRHGTLLKNGQDVHLFERLECVHVAPEPLE